MKFQIFHKDRLLADVTSEYNKVVIKQYYSDSDNWIYRPFVKDNISQKELDEWVESRCLPRTRHNLKEILKELGVPFYEPYLIVRKTHGVMNEDFYWIKFEGENLTWKDVKIRD